MESTFKQQTEEGKKVKLRNKFLLAISLVSMLLVIYQLWSTIPELAEYAGDAYLFQEPTAGRVWKDWVLEARDMFWITLTGMMLNVCFFFLISLWSFSEATEKRTENPPQPETKNQT
jgi:hypothetical protein